MPLRLIKTLGTDLPNIFGLEVENTWTYHGTGNNGDYIARDGVATKELHNPRTLYEVKRRENGEWIETQWLERKSGKVKLWGGRADFDGKTCTMLFSIGLEQAWYPMQVGERRFSTTTLFKT